MAKMSDLYAHWRDSARVPVFFFVDARGAIPVAICFFHPHWWLIGIAVFVLLLLGVLNYFGIPLSVAFRLLRGVLSGPKKHIRL